MSSNASTPKKAIERVSPFEVMAIVREAARYEDAIHFEVGQPDLPPPPGVIRALADLPAEAYGYTPSAGLWALREKIGAWYEAFYGLKIATERIFVTPGSSAALLAAYWLTLAPGDRIVLTDPSYPCYRNFAHLVSAIPRQVPVRAEEGYTLPPEAIERADRAVHILSPANPTGGFYGAGALGALAGRCRQLGVSLISDELYHGLWYDEPPQSALTFDGKALVTGGFSKSFCMPGFRLGWVVVPEEKIDAMERLAQNLYLCAPTPMQYAALEAFDEGYLEEVRHTYRRRRDWLAERLARWFAIPYRPRGAFYLWCELPPEAPDATPFCEALLRQERVAVTPGGDFGQQGRRFVRFAFTRDIAHMEEGVRRLDRFMATL